MIRSRATATPCNGNSTNDNGILKASTSTLRNTNHNSNFVAKQNKSSPHGSNSSTSKRPIPFFVIATCMVLAIMGMGYTSVYSMIYLTSTMDKDPPNRNLRKIAPQYAKEQLAAIRQQFQARYGTMADPLLKNGLHVFGSIDHTAKRLLAASQQGRPFVMAFSGYSVTVGRGNFFHQSFPFVVQDILKDTFQHIFGILLEVRNGAIGGIPSFPYGFCLEHFLGLDPDVISWDYSMNEQGKDASVLEAWIRQATQQLPNKPMIIMLDTSTSRMRLLDQYTQQGWLQDALAVGKKEILGDDETKVLAMDPLPPGFQEWDEFGAPPNCPGRGSWHPKKQEHALIGWLIAMHFVEAMERAIAIQENTHQQQLDSRQLARSPTFTKPVSVKLPDNDLEVTELLYGHPTGQVYQMKDLSCRTSFLPATDQTKTLPSVIVSGLAEGDLDIMTDRTDVHYQEGWVLDVSKVERETKRKVESCGGLGYIDMKIALYGTAESGKLRLWLPFEGPSHEDHDHNDNDVQAKHWFDDLIICEANEKRDDKACKLDRDMDIVVGGVHIESAHPIKGAGEYLKRTTCINVGVPTDATMTTLGDVRGTDGRPLSAEDKAKFGSGKDDATGLIVDITAKASVTRAKGACCLSHIVWEQH
ncbi:hypothetical protein IV203_025969 [Nitzschia inconspicua]|uniref:Uncharacterized protein n=1 Tax=Nitzschia inconspicua TaxID=303405 RepID=A0A9K3LHW2_9STRA|nr:hypothetical protein IV203_025969 [Nitzschia inconspicua]